MTTTVMAYFGTYFYRLTYTFENKQILSLHKTM